MLQQLSNKFDILTLGISLMLQNGLTHFKKSCKFKIYYRMQDHLLQDLKTCQIILEF